MKKKKWLTGIFIKENIWVYIKIQIKMQFKSIKKHNNKNNLKKFNSKIINSKCNFVNIHSELSKEEKISNNFKAFLKKLNDIN